MQAIAATFFSASFFEGPSPQNDSSIGHGILTVACQNLPCTSLLSNLNECPFKAPWRTLWSLSFALGNLCEASKPTQIWAGFFTAVFWRETVFVGGLTSCRGPPPITKSEENGGRGLLLNPTGGGRINRGGGLPRKGGYRGCKLLPLGWWNPLEYAILNFQLYSACARWHVLTITQSISSVTQQVATTVTLWAWLKV